MQRYLNDLIFDRTNADLLNNTDKAYIDYEDLNRIEKACEYLASLFDITLETKTWVMTDYRTASEMERLRKNIQTLKDVYADSELPTLPNVISYKSISEANTIEKLLYDIETLYLYVANSLHSLSFKLNTRKIGNRRFQWVNLK